TMMNQIQCIRAGSPRITSEKPTAAALRRQVGEEPQSPILSGFPRAPLASFGPAVIGNASALKGHAGACTTGVTIGTTSVVLSSSMPSIAAVGAQSSAALGANTSAATARANVATKAKGRAGGVLGATATQAKSKATGAVLGAT